jgi:dephospho-CoA kinase
MIIGLTGGIGSGKSAAANFFQNEGITVIDADDLAREVIEPNTTGFERILDYFGSKIIDSNGLIDRACLRKEVFDDDEKKKF